MDNIKLILDTGSFLFENVLRSYRKAQGFERGKNANPKFNNPIPDYTGYDADALRNFMVECFTVAAASNYELQERLKELVKQLQINPEIKDVQGEFLRQAKEMIPKYNYTGEQPTDGHLKTNLRTAMVSSYHAGLWDKVRQAGIYRFLQYKTREDERVRDTHRRLHNKIYNIDDPIWRRIYPPNGWNCRCYTKPLTHDEMNTESLNAEPITQRGSTEEKEIIKEAGVSKEFDRNAAMTKSIWGKWLREKMKGKDYGAAADRLKSDVNRIPEADYVFSKMKDSADDFIEPKLEPENFEQLFPGKVVSTVIGEFRLGDNFLSKLKNIKGGDRARLVSIIKPTLLKPEFVVVDSDYGTLFLKAFKEDKAVINYAAVIKNPKGEDEVMLLSFHEKENLLNKLKGGKLLIYSRDSIPSGQGVTGKQFSCIPDRLAFNLATPYSNVNDKNKRNEVWGEVISGEVYTSKVYRIRYGVEGFYVNDGERAIPYEKIDDWRRGALMGCRL